MNRRKKILPLAVSLLSLMLALLAAALLLAPVYLNSPAVRDKIQAAISRQLGGRVSYKRLDISLFPQPHVVFRQSTIRIPKTVNGTLNTLIIYPQMLPLVKGKLLFSRILVQGPDLSIILPSTGKARPELPTLEETKAAIRTMLSYLEAIGPDLVVGMNQGRFIVHRDGRVFLALRNVAFHFTAPPGPLEIRLRANTDRWGEFSLRGTYDFTKDRSEVKDLSVAMGHSFVTGFSAALLWEKEPRFEILSGKATFALDEIYGWLSSAESLTPFLQQLGSVKGVITLSSISGGGPASQPAAWRWRVSGEAANVMANPSRLPAPLSVSGRFTIEDNDVSVSDMSARLGRSSLVQVSARLAGGRKIPSLIVFKGAATLDLAEIFQWRKRYAFLNTAFRDIRDLSGTFRLSSMRLGGPLYEPVKWQIALAGVIDHVLVHSSELPGPLAAARGNFSLARNSLAFSDVQISLLDSAVTASGSLSDIGRDVHSLDIVVNGSLGRESLLWSAATYSIPSWLMVNSPLSLAQVHLTWQKPADLSLTGTVTVAGGPVLALDYSQNARERSVRRLAIKDQGTNADITIKFRKQSLDFSFSGTLAQATLNRIFANQVFGSGKVAGTLQATVRKDRLLDSTAEGMIDGDDIIIPWGLSVPVRIERVSLVAERNIVTITSAKVTWGKGRFSLHGSVTTSEDGFLLDMDIDADRIDVANIQQALGRSKREETLRTEDNETAPSAGPVIRGILRVKSAALFIGRWDISPVQAEVTLGPGSVNMSFSEAKACDIALPGSLSITRDAIAFDFQPVAKDQQLESVIACLAGQNMHMTGTFELNSALRAQGKSGAIMSSLEGKVNFRSRDGKIYRYPVLAKIFSVLSVIEVLRGKIPELGGKGFPYHVMTIIGDIRDGKLKLDHAYIAGSSVDIIAEGNVDFARKKMDLVVLVAPFSTINWIIRHIPLVGKIMGGTLISIPVKVEGDLTNPDVTFLAPSAVGTRILDILENILELPVEIISPILPKKKEEQK